MVLAVYGVGQVVTRSDKKFLDLCVGSKTHKHVKLSLLSQYAWMRTCEIADKNDYCDTSIRGFSARRVYHHNAFRMPLW
jgi:hypothetical protein